MNERIRLLAEQVGIKYGVRDDTYYSNSFDGVYRLDMEKFAELIVRECVGVVVDAVNYREPASTYVGKIKQHFGVEE